MITFLQKIKMFRISDQESKVLEMNIARGNSDCLNNPTALVEKLKESKVDVLKLTCENPSPDLYTHLDALHLEYYVLGIVLEYKSIFSRNPKHKAYLHTDVSFKAYTLANKDTLKFLVKNIFKGNPTSYFKNPKIASFLNQEKQLDVLFKYIATYAKELDESKYTHIMYKGNEPIGFVTSYKEGQGGGVLYAGILDKYVGKGYYIDLVRFIQNYGKGIQQKWGLAHAQVHHTVIQKTFIKEGLVPQGYTLNVHVNCLYGKLANEHSQF